ncbi:MAG: hypothetical protein M3300_14460, partial [Actinomycetota bacterium]|nr:hypothetical protein [Actinomycetota bacterium]
LHNQSALRIKARLLFEPRVMVTSVPWQLRSSARVGRREQPARGAVRWGMYTGPAGTAGDRGTVDDAPASGAPVTSQQRSVDRS